jgi:hypothetical protein
MKKITPTYVSFSQAKALKEKGFNDVECIAYYRVSNGYTKGHGLCYSNVDSQTEECLLCPEQWQVVEWLLKTKQIWISTKISFMGKFESEIYTKDSSGYFVRRYDFDSMKTPQEATSAAIDYVLEKFI